MQKNLGFAWFCLPFMWWLSWSAIGILDCPVPFVVNQRPFQASKPCVPFACGDVAKLSWDVNDPEHPVGRSTFRYGTGLN